MTSGIYCIENLVNGKKYIGQGVNVKKRMFETHPRCVALNSAIKKYSEKNFKRYVILYCEPDKKILAYYEITCIKIFHSHVTEGGYNIAWGGISAMTGRKHSKKTKQLMSKNNARADLGKHPSDETRRKISDARLKQKSPMLGKHHSKKTKQNLSKANSGKKHPMFGKHPSNETIQKISKATTGKHRSDETKRRISKARLGKHLSDKTIQKISEALLGEKNHMFGKHHSQKAIQKMSDAHQKYWENIKKESE